MASERDAVSQAILAAAERHITAHGVSPTQKRLLYEYLAYPGPNGKTLSGLFAPGATAGRDEAADIVYLTRRWFGLHIIKHYYVMRQYKDAVAAVLNFLRFLRAEAVLPASMAKALEASIEIGQMGEQQLPSILRIMKMPCARNEAFSRVYPLRPFPLCMVPAASEVKTSSSRHWPADNDQANHAWQGYVSERTRLDLDELDAVVQAVPRKLTITHMDTGRWEVVKVTADNVVSLRQPGGGKEFSVPFSAKRAPLLLPGMIMICTIVTLSDGSVFATDWGYVFPTYYAPVMDHESDFGPKGIVQLVY